MLLTLDDVGDEQGRGAVVAGQAPAGQVMLYLQGKQVPGTTREGEEEGKEGRVKERGGWREEKCRGKDRETER